MLFRSTLLVVALTVALPWTPLGHLFGFVPLPARFLPILALLVLAYVASAEMAKGWFYRRQAVSLEAGVNRPRVPPPPAS